MQVYQACIPCFKKGEGPGRCGGRRIRALVPRLCLPGFQSVRVSFCRGVSWERLHGGRTDALGCALRLVYGGVDRVDTTPCHFAQLGIAATLLLPFDDCGDVVQELVREIYDWCRHVVSLQLASCISAASSYSDLESWIRSSWHS